MPDGELQCCGRWVRCCVVVVLESCDVVVVTVVVASWAVWNITRAVSSSRSYRVQSSLAQPEGL